MEAQWKKSGVNSYHVRTMSEPSMESGQREDVGTCLTNGIKTRDAIETQEPGKKEKAVTLVRERPRPD